MKRKQLIAMWTIVILVMVVILQLLNISRQLGGIDLNLRAVAEHVGL